jgi:hypothetical protein
MSVTSFREADTIVDRFLCLLSKKGIHPPPYSGIESELLSVTELLALTKNLSVATGRPSLLAEAGGIFDLAAKVLSISNQPEFDSFAPHLGLFSAKLPLASAVQSTKGHATDDVHRKITELYLGSLAIHVGHNVEIDDPGAARGDNPDVLFDCVTEDGETTKRWALAIKTISSTHGQTIFERISDGSKQINAPACQAHRGIVVINAQGALAHSTLWSSLFPNEERAIDALTGQIRGLAQAAGADRPLSEWQEVFSGRTSSIVLYMGHAVVRIATQDNEEIPTVLKVLVVDHPTQCCDAEAESVAWRLNHYMQSITKGHPGHGGKQPQ